MHPSSPTASRRPLRWSHSRGLIVLLAAACGDNRAARPDAAGTGDSDATRDGSNAPTFDAGADTASYDGTGGAIDAGPNAPRDAGSDAASDASLDTAPDVPRDAPPDAAPDAPTPPADAAPVPIVRLADTVVDAPGATGTGFGDSTRAVNGVRGAGTGSGSLDVFSLGYVPDQNDHITLAWSNGRLLNGPGPDLVVFENPFLTGSTTFMDIVLVEVSIDGIEFRALAHDYIAPNLAVYVANPALWPGFAGRTPVLLNIDTHPVDPFDAGAAGGDQLDLDTVVGDDPVAQAIRANGVRFVRLVSAPARIDPHTGARYVRAGISNGADIDGVYGRYVMPQ